MEQQPSDRATAAIYLVFFVPIAILACAVDFVAIGFVRDALPRSALVIAGWTLNLVPAAIAGALPYALLAYWRRPTVGRRSRHLVRAAPLYAIVVLVAALVVVARNDRGFGLIAQLFVWPAAAAIGGIIADAIVQSRTRRPVAAIAPNPA